MEPEARNSAVGWHLEQTNKLLQDQLKWLLPNGTAGGLEASKALS